MNLFSKPTVEYCEKATNFIISRPGYAISNLPYIFLGVFLLSKKPKLAKVFGSFSILMGLASFIYDSTFTLLSQLVDLSMMFLFINFLLFINIRRLNSNPPIKKLLVIYIFLFAVFLFTTFILSGSTGRVLFGLSASLLVITEFYLNSRNKDHIFKNWLIALTFFIFGFGIWLLDANQIWCDTNNILNGRNIFHYLTAISIYYLYKHYQQFEKVLLRSDK
jgi:hypothetical protein